MTFEIDRDDPMTAVDLRRGVKVSQCTRDAGPDEVFISILELARRGRGVTFPGRVEFVNTDKPIKYFFDLDDLRRRALSRVLVASGEGVVQPLSLAECRSILVEVVPLLERARLQWQNKLAVEAVFFDAAAGETQSS